MTSLLTEAAEEGAKVAAVATGAFSWLPLVLSIAGILSAAAGAAWVTHSIDEAAYLKLEAKYKDAEVKAVEAAKAEQARMDAVSLDRAVKEAQAQQQIVVRTNTITKEVPVHVPLTSSCAVTVGFLRVLDAAVLGIPAEQLPLPAGQSDGSCAATDARSLASAVVTNYVGTCQANAEQLTQLQAWVRDIANARAATPKP